MSSERHVRMSTGSPRGGKTNIQIMNETTDKAHFYLSSDFKYVKKKIRLDDFQKTGTSQPTSASECTPD